MQYLTMRIFFLTSVLASVVEFACTAAIMRREMETICQSGGNPPPLRGTLLHLCETCLERGRERPGTHRVGAGFLCDRCFRGEGSPAERAGVYIAPREREVRRSYRRRNLERFREYQRAHRARQRIGAELLREGKRIEEDL